MTGTPISLFTYVNIPGKSTQNKAKHCWGYLQKEVLLLLQRRQMKEKKENKHLTSESHLIKSFSIFRREKCFGSPPPPGTIWCLSDSFFTIFWTALLTWHTMHLPRSDHNAFVTAPQMYLVCNGGKCQWYSCGPLWDCGPFTKSGPCITAGTLV